MKNNTKDIVVNAVDYIESLPEGSRTTTYRVLKQLYGEEEFFDAFELYFDIFDEIDNRGNVILDMSEHEDKVEGLPQNLDVIVRKK